LFGEGPQPLKVTPEKIDDQQDEKGSPGGKKKELYEVDMLQTDLEGRGYSGPEKNGYTSK
jgi:hypothetical protein